ncbi:MAG: hypothetical protein MO847_08985 [Candidatus Protistobacter heckmanni]|nr:hypothetical protein [Candidatus Protistobacter heckmanni]
MSISAMSGLFPLAVGAALLEHRLEGAGLRPFGLHHGLAIEVEIEKHGLGLGIGRRGKFGEDQRLFLVGERASREAALLEGLHQPVGVALHVGHRHRLVRDGQQLEVFGEARGGGLADRRLRGLRGIFRARRRRGEQRGRGQHEGKKARCRAFLAHGFLSLIVRRRGCGLFCAALGDYRAIA